ncbi:FAS1-like dehydratase domain-containing protein [Planococcus sp. 1R117A]|uniref:FAS1-like dehydratase domain-containing protein n=1 Tax=Planococcus sp. 1R117A TaxID=3447020 RepID=UPI003EDC8A2A
MLEAKENKIGKKFDEFTYRLEAGKVKELALAIGDDNPDYLTGKKLLPTIATVIDFWGGGIPYGQLLGLNLKKVLHGEQRYEYYTGFQIGEEITVSTEILDIQKKKGMDLYTVKREYRNQNNEIALIGYATIIEKH